jgi:hypothetical protein
VLATAVNTEGLAWGHQMVIMMIIITITINNMVNSNRFKVTHTIPEQHNTKHEIKEPPKPATLHCTQTAGSAAVAVQNIFNITNNITCSTDCKYCRFITKTLHKSALFWFSVTYVIQKAFKWTYKQRNTNLTPAKSINCVNYRTNLTPAKSINCVNYRTNPVTAVFGNYQ